MPNTSTCYVRFYSRLPCSVPAVLDQYLQIPYLNPDPLGLSGQPAHKVRQDQAGYMKHSGWMCLPVSR
jgi:hypothetical protein